VHKYLTEGVGLFIYILMLNYLVNYCYEGINTNVCWVDVSLFFLYFLIYYNIVR